MRLQALLGRLCLHPCPVINVVNLESSAFLFVPPAPSSTIIKSLVVKSAPISEPPSISIAASGKVPVSPVPINVPDAMVKLMLHYYQQSVVVLLMSVRVR